MRLRWWFFWGIAAITAGIALDAAWGGDWSRAAHTTAWLMGLSGPSSGGA